MIEKKFSEKVAEVNKVLDGYGADAITSEKKKDKSGTVIKTYTGYKVQYVIDAVNEAIGPENWRWEHPEISTERNPSGQSSTASLTIMLYMRVGDEWLTKGPVTGDSLNPVEADAMKGALSDGLKKSFAYWSIGNKAYRGELDETKSKTSNPQPAPKKSNSQPPSDLFVSFCDQINEAQNDDDLDAARDDIKAAVAAGKIGISENTDLVARGKARRAELTKTSG